MEQKLFPDLSLALPSGNAVRLLRLEAGEWLCEFLPGGNARGEVWFTQAWLARVVDGEFAPHT